MFLRSKVIKIPPKRETKNIYIPEDNTSLISMRCGEQLNWIKRIVSAVHITNPAVKTFLLTHAPLVGHELKASPKDVDVLKDFVNWVNNDKIGSTVEAVFCGHTHENRIFHNITLDNMNEKEPPHYDDPTCLQVLYFKYPTFYIETTTATKEYKHY